MDWIDLDQDWDKWYAVVNMLTFRRLTSTIVDVPHC